MNQTGQSSFILQILSFVFLCVLCASVVMPSVSRDRDTIRRANPG
jgi:hypothetical protein